jgi:hypothetical protein
MAGPLTISFWAEAMANEPRTTANERMNFFMERLIFIFMMIVV